MKKVCKKCERNRKLGKFGKLTASSDGKNPYCRDCMRDFVKRYKNTLGRNKQRKWEEQYKKKNKKAIREYNKRYYIENKTRILYNKRARSTISTEIPEKSDKLNINKGREIYRIKIDPKRKNAR